MGILVLLVDDEVELCELWAEVLEGQGHEVVVAHSVAEAQALLDDGVRPRLAVIDWSLPDGRGSAAAVAVRRVAPACRIVIATGLGHAIPPDHGADEILAKPFRIRELTGLIARWSAS